MVFRQPCEVIRDNHFGFFNGPRVTRRAFRLETDYAFVIKAFAVGRVTYTVTPTHQPATGPSHYASCLFGPRSACRHWKQGAKFWRG